MFVDTTCTVPQWRIHIPRSANHSTLLGGPQAQAGLVRATQRPTASLSLALTLPVDASLALGTPSLQQQDPGGGRAPADSLSPNTRVFRSGCARAEKGGVCCATRLQSPSGVVTSVRMHALSSLGRCSQNVLLVEGP